MSGIEIRRAVRTDISAIVDLLADDELGAARESPDDLAPYQAGFPGLDNDPNQYLMVAVSGDAIVGTFQLTLIPGLARCGATRAVIEAVRVHHSARRAGIGEQMIRWAVAESGRRGCSLVQLTSDKTRADAHRFYERLGFVPSHIGFKLPI
jgi:GNAT superfamily N-acetyltransferase